MAEVVEAELVKSPYASERSQITPARQKAMIAELKERHKKGDFNWTFSSLARRYRISPPNFIAAIHDAAKTKRHRFHSFAMDIFELWGEREEYLLGKSLELGVEKGRWEAFMTALERTMPEEYTKQSKSQPVVQIGVVEKLAMLTAGGKELSTGD